MTIHHTHPKAIELSHLDEVLEDYRKKQENEKFSMLLIPVYVSGQENEFTIRIEFHPEKIIPDVHVKSLQGSLSLKEISDIQRKVEDIFAPRFFLAQVNNPETDDESSPYVNRMMEIRASFKKSENIFVAAGKRILVGTAVVAIALFGLHLLGLHLLGFHVLRAAHLAAEAAFTLSAFGLSAWVANKILRSHSGREKSVTAETSAELSKPIPVKVSDSEGGSGASFSFKSFILKGRVSASGPVPLAEVDSPKNFKRPG